jgi:hypothetical protein
MKLMDEKQVQYYDESPILIMVIILQYYDEKVIK